MELGGNAPFIVFDDADLDLALNALLFSKYRNAGQACIASNRILVQGGVYDKFADMVVNATKNLHCGTVNAEGHIIAAQSNVVPTVGPLIDHRALAKVRFIQLITCVFVILVVCLKICIYYLFLYS